MIVFISYSHDDSRHSVRVRRMVSRLRREAKCDCRIDVDAEPEGPQWPRWMRIQIQEADAVLMIFTKIYRRRFDAKESPGRGRGVTWESTIIHNALYAAAAGSAERKFVPIVLDADDIDYVPRDVFSGTVYEFPKDWERLLKRLRITSMGTRQRIPQPFVSRPNRSGNPASTISVLFVGAEKGTGLDLREQLTKTQAAIKRAKFGRSVQLKGAFNLTPDEMLMKLNEISPQILHLSGRQENGQIMMHDVSGHMSPVSARRLVVSLGAIASLQLVILDTCGSLPEAKQVAQRINAAVGIAGDIAEPVATDFFAMFFNSMANGASVQRAYSLAFNLELAKIEGNSRYRKKVEKILETEFVPQKHLPQLVARRGINLSRVFITGS